MVPTDAVSHFRGIKDVINALTKNLSIYNVSKGYRLFRSEDFRVLFSAGI